MFGGPSGGSPQDPTIQTLCPLTTDDTVVRTLESWVELWRWAIIRTNGGVSDSKNVSFDVLIVAYFHLFVINLMILCQPSHVRGKA